MTRRSAARPFVTAAVVGLLVVILGGAPAHGQVPPRPPTLPVADGGRLLSNLSVNPIAAGGSATVDFQLKNPLASPIQNVLVTFQVYAFNAFPGNSSGSVPTASVELANSTASGRSVSEWTAVVEPNETFSSYLAVVATTDAPAGDYAIRTEVNFSSGSSGYVFESIGHFSPSLWVNATLLPNGSSTLNLSRLGVSGVVPETSVVVESPSIAPVVEALIGGALVLAAVGGFYAWRRTGSSRSGARRPPAPQRAERAFGKYRTNDGD